MATMPLWRMKRRKRLLLVQNNQSPVERPGFLLFSEAYQHVVPAK
jgi:hypothetical protein